MKDCCGIDTKKHQNKKHHNMHNNHEQHDNHHHNNHESKNHKKHQNNDHCHIKKSNDKDHGEHQGGHDHDHGYSGSKGTWKLLISIPAIFFAIWNTTAHIGGDAIFIPMWMMNPWFMFSFATFTIMVFSGNYIGPVFRSIKNLKLSISLFLAISILTAYFFSIYQMAVHYNHHHMFFKGQMFAEVIEIAVIVYIGALIENVVSTRTRKDIDSIMSLYEKKAILYKDGKEIEVDSSTLKVGDIILVKNGMKFPADGKIIQGNTTVDESSFTGESVPINKEKGSTILAGSISQGELVLVEITATFENSEISKVISSVQSVRAEKSSPAKLADQFGKFVLPFILIAGLLTLFITGPLKGWEDGIKAFVTTIIVACPMSYVLLTPTSSLIASSIAVKKGIVYKSSDIFENIKDLNAIAFDKTGTLTEGKLSIVKSTIPFEYESLVLSMETVSTHPIAKSIVNYFSKHTKLDISPKEIAGRGVSVQYNNSEFLFGSLTYIKEHSTYKEEEWIINEKKNGATFSYLLKDGDLIGVIQLQDKIKKSSLRAIKTFKEQNIEVHILTGDNEYAAHYVAKELDIPIENVHYDLNPEDKSKIIANLQQNNKHVAFVGDGINDTIALEQANIGVSIGEGSDVAVNSSDISLQKNDLNLILESLKIAKATLTTIFTGTIIATIYILTVVPIAVTGILLPFMGGVFMVINDTLPLLISSTLFRLKNRK